MTMKIRPSYEELENRVQELEQMLRDQNQDQEHLVDEKFLEVSNQRLNIALQGSKSGIWDWNLRTGEVFFEKNYFTLAGYEPDEFSHTYDNWKKRVHPDDIAKTEKEIVSYVEGKIKQFAVEFRFKTKSNKWMWVLGQGQISKYDNAGNPIRFTGTHLDINARKKAELELQQSHKDLEKKIKERTSELADINTTLKILLKKKNESEEEIEERIAANFKLRLSPIIDHLKGQIDQDQRLNLIRILETEMTDIISAFSKTISDPSINLTPMEIQVANLIKLGESNKGISNILNRSVHTISGHREKIREKLGLKNKKTNLRSFLLAL